jgi:CBS domain-containing protein
VIDVAVERIMQTDPVVVQPDMLLRDLVEVFASRRISGAPVVDTDGRVVGVVSESDLILQEIESDVEPPHFIPFFDGAIFLESRHRFERQIRKAFAATASDLMERDVETISPTDSVHEAAKRMARRDISSLPVVKDDRLAGVISRADVIRALAQLEFHTE